MEYNIGAYYEFLGRAIHLAMEDYYKAKDSIDALRVKLDKYVFEKRRLDLKYKQSLNGVRPFGDCRQYTKKEVVLRNKINFLHTIIRNYETADAFLSNPDWLERLLIVTGLSEQLNLSYIRKCAKTGEFHSYNVRRIPFV